MSWRAALLTIAFLPLTGIGGCASHEPDADEAEPQPRTTVVVYNRNDSSVNVYVVRGGARTRLGKVAGQKRRTFEVPPTFMVGDFVDVRVVADAVGEAAFVSEEMRVWPGDEIDLHVAYRIRNSWISVRPR